ncbi:sporulation protein YpjB [Bacillus ectoiniformans]|uniref:sporulation protein YpjB n=1 Tax=Bacillus ectoiniformans TaxID=1494429 RepID=UPI00195A5453|nr:sporulation protein YpjB [Bacillus ectoiniformans]MBM7647978.1 sporulation protein YpjB [Bacillus ectoiniformans]
MRILGYLLVICCFLMTPITSQAESLDSPLLKLDNIADQALEFTNAGRYSQAEDLLLYFNNEVSLIQTEGVLLSTSEWAVINASYQQALLAVQNPEGKERECVEAVTSFRLAVDAVATNQQPLWTEMEEPVMSAWAALKSTAKKQDAQAFNEALNTFLSTYNMIQPSLKVDMPSKDFSSLDSQIHSIDQLREKWAADGRTGQEMEQLEKELQMLFKQTHDEPAQPSLVWVISITGGIIISTLSYVSWRKFKGAQEEVRKKQKN